MSTTVKKFDFTWSKEKEPHVLRRKAILKAHPEIRNLFGPEPKTLPIVFSLVIIQLIIAKYMSDNNISWKYLVLVAYIIGGTINHTLQLAVHELSHNLCFKKPMFNKLLGIVGNLSTGFPSSQTFIRYHMEHHLYQGIDGIDTDIPTDAEVRIFGNSMHMKILWLFLQPAFYALRPLLINPKPLQPWEIFNAIVQISFDIAIVNYIGYKALAYLVIGTLLGLGLHPVAGHFVAEHYTLSKTGNETFSYYGPLNLVNFNVGYHNEHHDFPKIPWSRLPQVSKIAPEFYKDLPSYTSYVSVMYKYITDPTIGPFSRVKRDPETMGLKSPNKKNN